MRLTRKLVLTALAATALLAAIATTSAAREFETSETRIRTVFRPLILRSSSGDSVTCTVTLEGSFHYRTIRKVEGSLIGYITRAIVETPTCRSSPTPGITAAALTETLPWHITYVDFSGALPNVTFRIKLNRAGFNLINVPFIGRCRFTASPNGIVGGPGGNEITEGTRNSTIRAEEGIRIRSETIGCPEGQFSSGPTPVTVQGGTTAVTVRLI